MDRVGTTGHTDPPRTVPLRMVVVVIAVTIALAATVVATRQRIARNEGAQARKVLTTVLQPVSYDNEPDQDRILVLAPELLGSTEPVPVYRARLHGDPAAAIVTVVARQGFVGPIRLLVSLSPGGDVIAVRAIAQQETPGLGDRIDAAKSAWVDAFGGRSLEDPAVDRWAVKPDGGDFDQLTGATVTSRAVVGAVRDAALYFQQHRDEIFRRPAE